MTDVIVSDFDGVLFQRNHGLIKPVVKYVKDIRLPVVIVTWRAADQEEFISSQLKGVLPVVEIAFAGDRKKTVQSKGRAIGPVLQKYNVVEAIDNDEEVVLYYQQLGIPAMMVTRK